MASHSESPRPAPAGVLVVIAEFDVKPERLDEFIALALGFADECLANEEGCRQFQVVHIGTQPRGVLFYEAYDSDTAFEVHRRSAHLARFQAAFKDLVAGERPLRQGVRALG